MVKERKKRGRKKMKMIDNNEQDLDQEHTIPNITNPEDMELPPTFSSEEEETSLAADRRNRFYG